MVCRRIFYSLFRFEPSPYEAKSKSMAKSNCIKDGSPIEAMLEQEDFNREWERLSER